MSNIFDKRYNMDLKEFGKKLAALRKEKKISQDRMSKDLGISRATISSLESGAGVDVGIKKVLLIVAYLGYELLFKEYAPFPTFEELRDAR
jgi:transcriptional regulator with XRE-family HTH domain